MTLGTLSSSHSGSIIISSLRHGAPPEPCPFPFTRPFKGVRLVAWGELYAWWSTCWSTPDWGERTAIEVRVPPGSVRTFNGQGLPIRLRLPHGRLGDHPEPSGAQEIWQCSLEPLSLTRSLTTIHEPRQEPKRSGNAALNLLPQDAHLDANPRASTGAQKHLAVLAIRSRQSHRNYLYRYIKGHT